MLPSQSSRTFVPQEMLVPGFEAVYTGEISPQTIASVGWPISRFSDENGRVYEKWSLWTWRADPSQWDEEIRFINTLQTQLGPIDDAVRQVRAQIGSLVLCDAGIPVTIDDLLAAVGRGRFLEPPLHTGCWCGSMAWQSRSSQPERQPALRAIEQIVRSYLAGGSAAAAIQSFPPAASFIHRLYAWLPPADQLKELQRLMLARLLLPFEFFTGRNQDYDAVNHDCFEDGGRGAQLDDAISALAGLPRIYANYKPEFNQTLETITDPDQADIYRICGALAHGLHGLSDCHHAAFRWIERWLHDIGSLSSGIAERRTGSERRRLAELLFGYTLGLDQWLLGGAVPFLLLDLAYVDLGCDPKNEILRVYAYLGEEHSPVKEWLAACLWKSLAGVGSASGLLIQKELNLRARGMGFSARQWIEARLLSRNTSVRSQARPSAGL
jgi:hypothetical protein